MVCTEQGNLYTRDSVTYKNNQNQDSRRIPTNPTQKRSGTKTFSNVIVENGQSSQETRFEIELKIISLLMQSALLSVSTLHHLVL